MSDDFNFDGKPTRGQGGGMPMNMWDMLSILVLVITVGMVLYFAFIFINPDSPINFLRPGQLAGGAQGPTATPTLLQLASTWTPSPTLVMTPTDTPRPTFTPISTDTPFSLVRGISIYREKGKLYMDRKFGDGSADRVELVKIN